MLLQFSSLCGAEEFAAVVCVYKVVQILFNWECYKTWSRGSFEVKRRSKE